MGKSADDIRRSFREQTDASRGFFGYCFESLAASLEILLHYNIGMAYLSFVRSFVIPGMFMIFAYLMCFDVELRSFGEALGGKSSSMRSHESMVRMFSGDKASVTGFLAAANISPVVTRPGRNGSWRIFPVVVASNSTALVWPATLLIFGICRAHMFYNFGRDRFRKAGIHRYAGEPFPVWNPLYVLFDRLNFRSNLVKVLCEPLLCIGAGVVIAKVIQQSPVLSDKLLFVARWLFWGGIVLGVKAGLDQKQRVTEIMNVEDHKPSRRATSFSNAVCGTTKTKTSLLATFNDLSSPDKRLRKVD